MDIYTSTVLNVYTTTTLESYSVVLHNYIVHYAHVMRNP